MDFWFKPWYISNHCRRVNRKRIWPHDSLHTRWFVRVLTSKNNSRVSFAKWGKTPIDAIDLKTRKNEEIKTKMLSRIKFLVGTWQLRPPPKILLHPSKCYCFSVMSLYLYTFFNEFALYSFFYFLNILRSYIKVFF